MYGCFTSLPPSKFWETTKNPAFLMLFQCLINDTISSKIYFFTVWSSKIHFKAAVYTVGLINQLNVAIGTRGENFVYVEDLFEAHLSCIIQQFVKA